MLKLEATTDNEKAILNYLEQNASEALAAKINAGKKTLSDCMSYIKSEARNMARNGCAMIEDKVVFGWAVHFFEEDYIQPSAKVTEAKAPAVKEEKIVKLDAKREEKKETKKAADTQMDGQTSIFDLLGV